MEKTEQTDRSNEYKKMFNRLSYELEDMETVDMYDNEDLEALEDVREDENNYKL